MKNIIHTIKEKGQLPFLLFFLTLFSFTNVWAEGSKDLYPNGATGGRAFLLASTTGSAAFPFPTLGTHYVYAEVGEQIALATSAQAWGTNNSTRNSNRQNIRLFGPNGQQITLTVDNNASTIGRIDDRTAELAGPQLPAQTGGNRYTPLYHTVTQAGIYKVEFLSTSGSETGNERISYVAANANWIQPNNSNYLAAWDISVAKQTGVTTWAWQNGRVYTQVLNMDNPSYGGTSGTNNSNFRPNSGFYGKFKVLTRDGYVYNVDNNGNQGISFTFMVNNRGFHAVGDVNTPSYQSIAAPNAAAVTSRYHDPRTADNAAVVTQKIFYNLPDGTMPETATGAVPGSATWLRTPEKLLNITDVKITGVEGTQGVLGHKGAYIEFTNTSGGDYYITIKPKVGSGITFPTRVFSGQSIIGLNKILWNGKDGAGNTLPAGTSDIEIELNIRGAEVHFPYIDMELNHNGIVIELLNTDLQSVKSDQVYWDDSNIRTVTTGSMTSPRNASHTVFPNGTSSNTNGHIWGTGSNGTSGTFGDEQGMDTWTFIEGDKVTIDFDAHMKIVDLYTDIAYKVNGVSNATSATVGQSVEYTVTAGNMPGYSDVLADPTTGIKGAPFTFTVPVGVDITNPNAITFTTNCTNGTVSESVAMTYNPSTRVFSSELNLPSGCSITYTFTGTINGSLGLKTAESTIMRQADVTDIDATNGEAGLPPSNPHYECYNDSSEVGGSVSGDISCNNINEVTFMLLQDCTTEYLYYEDFGRGYFAQNDGRTDWTNKASIGLGLTTGMPSYDTNGIIIRNGQTGGATSSYLFAPGQHDTRYTAANAGIGHSAVSSVARIKNGYYSVNPPGYVQMGIPDTDPWYNQVWYPGHPTDFYDWTPAWTLPETIRDVSGAVNGSAFLIRGSASASQSVKPFYEFNVATPIVDGETYTLSLYSYVTYHDKDYMIMDVVDQDNGHVYASVPLKYPGPGLPPGATPEGFSLGWVPLQASVKFNSQDCVTPVTGKNIKIAIRGSQDRALETGKGFGHTLIDDISFTKRTIDASCDISAEAINCEDDCYEEVEGEGFGWRHDEGQAPSNPVVQDFIQPGTNGGFVLDIYKLDNSFNMLINGVPLHTEELEFQAGTPSNLVQNVRFKADGKKWGETGVSSIWNINDNLADNDLDMSDRFNNPTPAIRVIIDRWGNVTLMGKKNTADPLEELEVFDKITGTAVNFSNIGWNQDITNASANQVQISQNVIGETAAYGFGYGKNYKECETCTIEKEGIFTDENNNGLANAGETITYTFTVKNAGDMDIHDVEIIDPLFNFTIKLDENTHLPIQSGVTLLGDNNTNGVLDRNETWIFTVQYQITSTDIYTNKGVYNRAEVKGLGRLPSSDRIIDGVLSTDPTPYTDGDEGWDPSRPFHTYVPLKGSSILITNPMIRQRVK